MTTANCLIFIIFFKLIAINCDENWCTSQRYVSIPYDKLVTTTQVLTRRTFFNYIKKYEVPYSYYEKRYKYEWQSYTHCCSGYELKDDDCKPICSVSCPLNGYCKSPENCICLDGYENRNNICVPLCLNGCNLNEYCYQPNACKCVDGYTMNDQSNSCLPYCVLGCPENEYCNAPNSCDCLAGYERKAEKCVPKCELDCPLNGNCTAPNECSCLTGYRLENGNCLPICEEACKQDMFCSAPNECTCSHGYIEKQIATNATIKQTYCEPKCERSCPAYAKCVKPNQCECYPGYELSHTSANSECKSHCKDACVNGFCSAPDTCTCNSGYLMGPNMKCIPTCKHNCVNGQCTEPEICQCNEGYRFANNSLNVCEAICEPNCENGTCAGPNICICALDYKPHPEQPNKCMPMSNTFTTAIIKDDLTMATTPMLSTNVCNFECKCWQKMYTSKSLLQLQCEKVCLDEYDQPCLNVVACTCHSEQLKCLEFNKDYSNGAFEMDISYYECKIRLDVIQPTTIPTITTLSTKIGQKGAQSKGSGNHVEHQMKWYIIGGVIVVVLLLITIAYVSWRIWKHRKEQYQPNDDFEVNCDDDNLSYINTSIVSEFI